MEIDPSSPSEGQMQVRRRMHDRAALILPESSSIVVVFAGEEGRLAEAPELAARAAPVDSPPLDGYRLAASRPMKTYRPLSEALGEWHPLLGRPFRTGAFFGHVGARPCSRRVPGWQEEYWLRDDLAGPPRPVQTEGGFPLACVTAGGMGFAPIVGATLASLVTAILLGLVIALTSGAVAFGVICATLVLSTALCVKFENWAARWFLDADAREFVLDEVAGMAATLLIAAPTSAGGVAVAFLAFRFFDVLKPGIHWLEKTGWRGTVVWDDLAAGVMAGVATLALDRAAAAMLGHVF